MSDKIKSKDLSYDSTLPPFLQRLHAKNAGRGDTDRHERPLARPKKSKDPNDDDGPTVVDESGETVSKEELDKLTNTISEKDTENVTGTADLSADPKASGALPGNNSTEQPSDKKTASNVTDGISLKKRKAVKVIGEDEATEGEKQDDATPKTAKKPKKKPKVKMTFDEDEGS